MTKPVKVITFKWAREGYRSKFGPETVNVFASMLSRHATVPYKLLCITDDPAGLDSSIETLELWPEVVPQYGGGAFPNCFRRLPLFGAELSRLLGPRWIWSDLDALIVGNVDHLLTCEADFKIWRPSRGASRCNGSLVAHRAGTRTRLWEDFDPARVGTVEEFRARTRHIGSDQAWIAANLTEADEFFGEADGVYAFRDCRNQFRERWLGKMQRIRERRGLPPGVRERDAARRERRHTRLEERDARRAETAPPPNAAVIYFPGSWHPWDEEVWKVYPWVKEHWR